MKKANIEDIKKYAELIGEKSTLCNLTGKCESEVMICQTICAAANNFNKHGEAFSFKAISNNRSSMDNLSAYACLLKNQYIIEEERDKQTVIFPTQRLIHKLADYFND